MNNQHPKTILIVEDEFIIAMHTKYKLEDFGYEVMKTDTGEEAVKLATQDESIDLILMDITLSGEMDGTDAAKQILAVRHIPIIFLTAYAEEEYVERVKEITRYGYVIKNSGDFVLKSSIEMAFELFYQYEKTRKSEEKYRTLLQNIEAGVVVHDADTRIVSCNAKSQELLGLTEDQMLGKSAMDPDWKLLNENGTPMPFEAYPANRVAATNQPIRELIVGAYRSQHDDIKWFTVNADPIFDTSGEIEQIIVTFMDITDRKKAEQALQKSETFLNAVGKMAKVGGWEMDAETNEVSWTEETYRIHEVPLDYKPPLEEAINFFHPKDQERLTNAIQNALNHGEPYDLELRFITAKRRHLWVRTICKPLVVDDKVVKLMGTFQDIDAHKKTEEKIQEQNEEIQMQNEELRVTNDELFETLERLRESEEKYRALVETIQEGIWQIDGESYTTYVNPKMAEILGYSVDEMMGKHLFEFMDNRGVELCKERLESRRKGIAEQHDFEFIRKNGDRIYVLMETTPVIDEDGNYGGALAAVIDITDRKEAQIALKESEKKFKEIFNSTSEAIIIHDDKNGKMIDCNEVTMDMYGYDSKDEMLSLVVSDFSAVTKGFDQEKITKHMQKAVKDGSHTFEWLAKKKSGEEFWVEVSLRKTKIGGKGRILAVVRDINDRKQAEEKIQQQTEEIQMQNEELRAANEELVETNERLTDLMSKLEESEEVMRYIIKHDPNAIAVYDRELHYIAVSNRYLEDYDVTEKDILGKHHYEVFPEMPQRWKDVHQRVLQGNIERSDDDYFERPDGSITYNRWECRPWYKADGTIGGMITYTEVTTARKLAEKALKASEEKFRRLFENSSSLIMEVDADTFEIISCNPQMATALNSRPEKIIGKRIDEFLPNDIMKNRRFYGEKALSENKVQTFEDERNGRYFLNNFIPVVSEGKSFVQAITYDITDRKQMEMELQESLREIEIITASIPNIIWKTDIDEDRNFVNSYISDAVDEFLELPPNTIGNSLENYFSYVKPKYMPIILEKFDFAAENPGEIISCEYEVVKANGKAAWFSSSGRVYKENDTVKAFGFTIDITDCKQAEEKLRKSEESFRAIFETAEDSIFIKDENLKYKKVNPAFERLFETSADQLVDKTDIDLFGEEAGKQIIEMDKRVLAGETIEEFPAKPVNGVLHYFHTIKVPLRDGDGTITGLCGIARDITERKMAEQELNESEERFRAAFQQSAAGMAIVLPNEKIIDVNEKLCQMLGYTKEEFLNMTVKDITVPEDKVKEVEYTNDVISGKKDYFNIEKRYIHKDGHIVWTNLSSNVVKDDGGNIKFAIGVIVDITERKQAEEELKKSKRKLQQANDTKDRFFNIIAHDLKTPLNVFNSGIGMLHDHFQNTQDDTIQFVIDSFHEKYQHLKKLVENLLTWAESQRGEVPYNPRDIELNHAVMYVWRLLKHSASEKNISFSCPIDEALVVYADYEMLKFILRNLITNAIKFTEDGGKITVDATDNGDVMTVSISDDGVGIPEGKQQRLFRVGEKDVNTTGTAGEKGTGLGLILCKEFVDKHGGEIWVESQEGNGSTFTFTLPKNQR